MNMRVYLLAFFAFTITPIFNALVKEPNHQAKELLTAARNNDAATITKLLDQGVNPDAQDGNGNTSLMWAVNQNNKPIVMMLLKAKANLNLKNNKGWTALMGAAANGHKEMVEILLKSRANANIQNKEGKTAKDLAIKNNHPEIADLIESKTRMNLGDLALPMAAQRIAQGKEKLEQLPADLHEKILEQIASLIEGNTLTLDQLPEDIKEKIRAYLEEQK